jgi:hypothetical protein
LHSIGPAYQLPSYSGGKGSVRLQMVAGIFGATSFDAARFKDDDIFRKQR